MLYSISEQTRILSFLNGTSWKKVRIPDEVHDSKITKGCLTSQGKLILVTKDPERLYVLDSSGTIVNMIEDVKAQEILEICSDQRGFFYAISESSGLLKFDPRGRPIHSHPFESPRSLFLSRLSSQERFLAVTSLNSNAITVFQSAGLDRLVTQDLEFSAAGMLNSEIIAPKLVYMTDPSKNRVVTYEDYGRKFHFVKEFKIQGSPSKIVETHQGIFVLCKDTGRTWVQIKENDSFQLLQIEESPSFIDIFSAPPVSKLPREEGFQQTYGLAAQRLLNKIEVIKHDLEDCGLKSESNSQMDRKAFDLLSGNGFLHLTLPRSVGGEELAFNEILEVISKLAYVDSSAGWASSISCAGGYILSFVDEKIVSDIFQNDSAIFLSGSHAPTGRMKKVQNGWMIDGSWTWCSFCDHAKWLMGQCILDSDIENKDSDAPPEMRLVIFQTQDAKIERVWDTFGMRGTGSERVHADNLFVPDKHVINFFHKESPNTNQLYRIPAITLFSASIAAVSLGIAERALKDAFNLYTTKIPQGTRGPLSDRALAKLTYAHSKARVEAARSYLMNCAQSLNQLASTKQEVLAKDKANMRLACSWVVKECTKAIDSLYQSAGGAAVFKSNPLQKHFRDAHVITQHMGVSENTFELFGDIFLEGKKDSFFL